MLTWTGFRTLAERLGVAIDSVASQRLETYLREVGRWGKAVNLVGPSAPQRILDELVADALPLASILAHGQRLLDVGSGAGLPGLVLAVLCPTTQVELWEPRERRAAFLRAAVQLLGLTNARVLLRRLEAGEGELPFDVLCARAVWPPAEWLRLASSITPRGGLVALQATAAYPVCPDGLVLERVLTYRLPEDSADRDLVLYRRP